LQVFSELGERAADALRALDGWEEVWELRVQLGGFAQIGLLGPVPQELKGLRRRMVAALRRLLNDPAPETAQGEFAQFQAELQAYRPLLEGWQAAAQAFMDAKELIYYGTASYEAILARLAEAWGSYSQVGDAAMAAEAGSYIEALKSLREGARLISGIGCERGLELLRRAEYLFKKLGEAKTAARVHRLILARPGCYRPS
ncbi:MAG: hypothetical protein ACE5LQ_01000, partial [Candidatus Bipolaricaulia bacterium]